MMMMMMMMSVTTHSSHPPNPQPVETAVVCFFAAYIVADIYREGHDGAASDVAAGLWGTMSNGDGWGRNVAGVIHPVGRLMLEGSMEAFHAYVCGKFDAVWKSRCVASAMNCSGRRML
jgi:hypothetical protein